MYRALIGSLCVVFVVAGGVRGQSGEMVRFAESFAKDVQYHVDCRVEIDGSLPVPPTPKVPNPKPLQVVGRSSIKYDERILQVAANARVERTLRYYRQMDFQRKVGDDEQRNHLRPEAYRLVILRHNHYEVPFCPNGPLTWGEIELVRTDVFVPALAGLYPTQAASVGQRWRADTSVGQEFTDLEKIDKCDVVCTFEKITSLAGRRYAHVSFEGKVQGVGEDGNSLHELRGSFHYDIDANFLSYLSVKGTHNLLNKSGSAVGKVEGTFVLTRARTLASRELTDEANRGLVLEPTAENSLLLFEQPKMGVRILHPRNWRVAGGNDTQVGIDENRGSGMLITLTQGAATPTGAQFYQETLTFLQKQQARFKNDEKPRTIQTGIETFGFEGEVGKDQVALRYYVVRQGNHGATIAVRMPAASANATLPDVDRMVRSMRLGR